MPYPLPELPINPITKDLIILIQKQDDLILRSNNDKASIKRLFD